MFIPLAGTKGSVTGCTLVATTEYPKPKPNLGGADLPLVPVVPKRKLVLDCSAMTVQLDKVHFTYEDSQQAGVFYSAYIQLTLTGVGKAVKAESLFNDAHPAA
ncbi:hypothetical protein Rsub_00104 [Raphidocelis subcapitata]|uniref:Uncharacterized protein n=1 Tax=Raphidocelis subcapitata TaxID=307507 RepID=A0A2V0NPF1_9CHLO|nr:hypothetical protein Rsub_00104 [Raphidocelis subcapitata]|eukprot:GBF87393.1 hypothetical protein Rsub_00104 [Raphidocelis subcapitata]